MSKDTCRQKELYGCIGCQFYIYGKCEIQDFEDETKKLCGFGELEECTRKCIYYATCTRNPHRKHR